METVGPQAQGALAWLLGQTGLIASIVGASEPGHLVDAGHARGRGPGRRVLQVIRSIIVLRACDAGKRGMAMGIFGFGVALTPSYALMATTSPGTLPWVPMRRPAVGRIGLGFVLPSLTLGALPRLAADAPP